jgi:transglutaminase-like putative cysteine protease
MNALRDLVLLGFVCQSLAAESWLQAVVFCLLGLAAARRRRPQPLIGQNAEALLFVLGMAAAYRYSRTHDFPLFVSLGYPLLGVQMVRLAGPSDARARLFSLGIAVVHLGIGCLSIFDWKAALLLLCTIVLVPRALAALEAESFGAGPILSGPARVRTLAGLVALMLLFFVLLPRSPGRRALPLGLVPAVLDATRGGSEAAEQPLFHIEGDQLGYLRIGTLDTFDGTLWTASQESAKRVRSFGLPDPARQRKRTVRLLAPDWTGPVCPMDGRVAALEATFLTQPGLAASGALVARRTRLREENLCVYWSEPGEAPEPLSAAARERLTALPAQPERLQRWLDQALGSQTDGRAQAERLAAILRETFTYDLGAPSLRRLSPTEDFIFNQKSGHCERFASALAVLLRMKGIPARVALGYLPLDRNRSGSTTSITAKQGHAWTEAWFEGHGWIALDATPYAGDPQGMPVPFLERAQEWIRDFWYQNVVFFSGSDQSDLFQDALGVLHWPLVLLGGGFGTALAAAAAAVALFALARWALGLRLRRSRLRADSAERARHFYGQMLRLLARRGYRRGPAQTPLELLQQIRDAGEPLLPEIELVTQEFCRTRYRETLPDAEQLGRIEQALRRLSTLTTRRA